MPYNTEQKKAILAFLRANSEQQYTAEQIAQALPGAVGVSTVYRRLPELVEHGQIKRFARPGRQKAVYQAVTGEHCDAHLHMKCMDCGRLLHMGDAASERIIAMIKEDNSFDVSEQTVLYGRCAECKR